MRPPPLLAPLLCAALTACGAPHPPPRPHPPAAAYACLLPAERRMLVAEMFFGREIRGRKSLTEAEWTAFARDVVTPNFPAGFTTFNGAGQWQNPATGVIGRERTKILLVATPRSADLAPRLAAVIGAYKARFHQQSVGVVTRDACAAF